jgi:hypothetical protein
MFNGPLDGLDYSSKTPSGFPPIQLSPRVAGTRSENNFYLGYRHTSGANGGSLLVNHFGFTTIRPDTFSGIQQHRRLKVAAATGNDGL